MVALLERHYHSEQDTWQLHYKSRSNQPQNPPLQFFALQSDLVQLSTGQNIHPQFTLSLQFWNSNIDGLHPTSHIGGGSEYGWESHSKRDLPLMPSHSNLCRH